MFNLFFFLNFFKHMDFFNHSKPSFNFYFILTYDINGNQDINEVLPHVSNGYGTIMWPTCLNLEWLPLYKKFVVTQIMDRIAYMVVSFQSNA